MNDRDEHIVNSLRRWIDGNIDQKEENRLDRQAREDSFLGEALEGYRQFPGSKHQERLERMREQLQTNTQNGKKRGGPIIGISYRIAAAAAIVLAFGLFWWLTPTTNNELAEAPQALERSSESMANEAAPAVVEDQNAEEESTENNERRIRPERDEAGTPRQALAAKQDDAQLSKEEEKPGQASSSSANNQPAESLAARQLDSAGLQENVEDRQIAARSRSEIETPDPAVSAPPPPPPPPPPANDITIGGVNLNAPQGTRLVTGQVLDRSGTPLNGVLVVTPGDHTGTITNINGQYEILLDSTVQQLEFQRNGFSSQNVDITDSQDFVRVTLDESAAIMDQMVQAEAAAKKSKSNKVNPAVHASSLNLNIAEPEISLNRFDRYLRRNLEYPQAAIDGRISGSVTLRFTILPDGRVMNVQAIAGPNELRPEAVRLIEQGPEWNITNGSDKSITFTYRLDFSL